MLQFLGFISQVTPESMASIITAATNAGTGIVSAAQVGIIVTAGAAVGLGMLLLRRGLRAGR